MNKPVDLGGRSFRTKNDLQKEVRRVLDEAQIEVKLTENWEYFGLLLNLLKRHPSAHTKIGCGVQAFQVSLNEYRTRGFYLIRADGTKTDWSYRECITASSRWTLIAKALRYAVNPQVVAFKEVAFGGLEVIRCSLSRESLRWESCDVDHECPTFDQIARDFLVQAGLDESTFPLGPSEDLKAGRTITNPDLVESWNRFHLKHAKLRVISRIAHHRGVIR